MTTGHPGMASDFDRQCMLLAFDLARRGLGWVNPNPTVGAVLAKDGRILGRGFHRRCGGAHAEIEAMREARAQGHLLDGATLYVTLEPCCHTGRTAPCVDAIVREKIGRVVISEIDPNPLVCGKGVSALRAAGLAVETGLFLERALGQNDIFRHWVRHSKPWVALKMSVSLDGKISPARKTKNEVFYLIGEAAQRRVHWMRQEYDSILVGVNTVLQDNPQLTTRLADFHPLHHPMPIVLDAMARTPVGARLLRPILGRRKPLIVVGPRAPKKNCVALEKKGAQVLVVAKKQGRLALPPLLKQLAKTQIASVMVEGGAQVAKSFLENQLVDQLDWVLAPMLLGENGIPAVAGQDMVRQKFTPVATEKLGSDIWVRWKR